MCRLPLLGLLLAAALAEAPARADPAVPRPRVVSLGDAELPVTRRIGGDGARVRLAAPADAAAPGVTVVRGLGAGPAEVVAAPGLWLALADLCGPGDPAMDAHRVVPVRLAR